MTHGFGEPIISEICGSSVGRSNNVPPHNIFSPCCMCGFGLRHFPLLLAFRYVLPNMLKLSADQIFSWFCFASSPKICVNPRNLWISHRLDFWSLEPARRTTPSVARDISLYRWRAYCVLSLFTAYSSDHRSGDGFRRVFGQSSAAGLRRLVVHHSGRRLFSCRAKSCHLHHHRRKISRPAQTLPLRFCCCLLRMSLYAVRNGAGRVYDRFALTRLGEERV